MPSRLSAWWQRTVAPGGGTRVPADGNVKLHLLVGTVDVSSNCVHAAATATF